MKSGKYAGFLAIIPSCQHSFIRATVDRVRIAITNQKGGVGKSTLAVHLAVWLHDRGAKVALLDLDKQRSSSLWIGQAEPKITIRTAATPDECLSEVQNLAACHDFVVGDGPGGLDDISRTLLILADLALMPITPSLLDVRSVQQASSVLRYAQKINNGRPMGRLILNKMKTRDTISRELKLTAPNLGMAVTENVIRDLQQYRDAVQQGTVVTRTGRKGQHAAEEINRLFAELLPQIACKQFSENLKKEVING
ncbi:MAG TPA: ParA family protein [Gemmataceae bacterium]|nr:ParA family protein [Gemmataceae bacterium]